MPTATAQTAALQHKPGPFRILSLPGGGVRGRFQAEYLRGLEARLENRLASHFELIAGTSIGAILALGIARGSSASHVSDVVSSAASGVFPKGAWLRRIFRGAPYDPEPLRLALDEILHDIKLEALGVDVLATAVTLESFKCKVFTTLPADGHETDRDLLATDVALASSAAPWYLPAGRVESDDRTFVDGGLYANDPSFFASLYAHKTMGVQFGDIRILRVGCGVNPQGMTRKRYDMLRPYSLSMVKTLVEMSYAAQRHATDISLEMVPRENVLTVDPVLPGVIALDDACKAEQLLPAIASERVNQTSLEVAEFLGVRHRGRTGSGDSGMSPIAASIDSG